MRIHLASHYGMCFGVRDAIAATREVASTNKATVLGQLVHNPVVQQQMSELGVESGELESNPQSISTEAVVFTAHGVADSVRNSWADSGKAVFDTTCPLVKKAHRSLECLVLGGFHPVVIGKRNHVEVKGLVTDFPEAITILTEEDIDVIPLDWEKIGVISQTTQPINRVEFLVGKIREKRPSSEVRFIDTVCQPTKNRQRALAELIDCCDTMVVVGGNNSNNTRQLSDRAREAGCDVIQVETSNDLDDSRFVAAQEVGVTAGTSTLEETVREVVCRLEKISVGLKQNKVFESTGSVR